MFSRAMWVRLSQESVVHIVNSELSLWTWRRVRNKQTKQKVQYCNYSSLPILVWACPSSFSHPLEFRRSCSVSHFVFPNHPGRSSRYLRDTFEMVRVRTQYSICSIYSTVYTVYTVYTPRLHTRWSCIEIGTQHLNSVNSISLVFLNKDINVDTVRLRARSCTNLQ